MYSPPHLFRPGAGPGVWRPTNTERACPLLSFKPAFKRLHPLWRRIRGRRGPEEVCVGSFWVGEFVVWASLERVVGVGKDVALGAVNCWGRGTEARRPGPVAEGLEERGGCAARKGESGRIHCGEKSSYFPKPPLKCVHSCAPRVGRQGSG